MSKPILRRPLSHRPDHVLADSSQVTLEKPRTNDDAIRDGGFIKGTMNSTISLTSTKGVTADDLFARLVISVSGLATHSSPLLNGRKYLPTTRALVCSGGPHHALGIPFDDWLIAGRTALLTFVD